MISERLRIQLYCTIFIFLFAAYSTDAQELDAVQWERVAWESDDVFRCNDALILRALCLKSCGRYADALESLSRVRMYALDSAVLRKVLYEKELCAYLSGDYRAAESFYDEARVSFGATECILSPDASLLDDLSPDASLLDDLSSDASLLDDLSSDASLLDAFVLDCAFRWDEAREKALAYAGSNAELCNRIRQLYGKHPRRKNPVKAMFASCLPPLGHIYVGKASEGFLSAALNAGAAAWTALNIVDGLWITGGLGGAIALNYTFMGNQQRVQELVQEHNDKSVREFNEKLKQLFRQAE